jgi:hypothetical protein
LDCGVFCGKVWDRREVGMRRESYEGLSKAMRGDKLAFLLLCIYYTKDLICDDIFK